MGGGAQVTFDARHAPLVPELVPGLDADNLVLLRLQGQAGYLAVGFHQTGFLQGIQGGEEGLVVFQGRIQAVVVPGGEEHVHIAVGVSAVVQFRGFHQFGVVVVQVAEVAVKFHARAEGDAHDDEDDEGADNPLVAVPRQVVELFHQRETVRVPVFDLLGIEEMREEHQHKERVAQQGEGGEHAEVPEEIALRKQQAQEGTHGGNATQHHGCALLRKHFLYVGHVIEMDEYM